MKKVILFIILLGLCFLTSCTKVEKAEIILELKGNEKINTFQHLVYEGYLYGTGATDSSTGDFEGAIGDPCAMFLFKLELSTNEYEIKQLFYEYRGYPVTTIAMNPAGNLVVAGYLSGVTDNLFTIVISEFDTDLNLLSQNYVDHPTAAYVSFLSISNSGNIGLITMNSNILILDNEYHVLYSRANSMEEAFYEEILVDGDNFLVVGFENKTTIGEFTYANSVVRNISSVSGLQWIANFDMENGDKLMHIFHSETEIYKALGIHRINDDEYELYISDISNEGEISNVIVVDIAGLTYVHEIGRIGDNFFVLCDISQKNETTHFIVLLNQKLRIINQYEVVGDHLDYHTTYVDNGAIYVSYNNDRISNDSAKLIIEKIKYKD